MVARPATTTRGCLRAAPRLVWVLAAAAVLGGCGFGGGEEQVATATVARVAAGDAAGLVLQAGDLSTSWDAFDVGPETRTDIGSGRGADAAWKARYRRSGATTARGPLLVDSRASVFPDAASAAADLDALERDFARFVPGARRTDAPELGDAAVAATHLEAAAAGAVRFHFLAWRQANVVSILVASGFDEQMTLDDVVALARAQERRVVAATGD